MEIYFRRGLPPPWPDVTIVNEEIVVACTMAECSVQYSSDCGYTVSFIASMREIRR